MDREAPTSTADLTADRFRQILETAPDAMLVVDDQGCILLVNAQTEKVFGYARDQLLKRSVDMLIPDRFRHSHAGHVARYFAHPGTRPMGSGLQLFGRRSDGKEFPIEVSLSPVGNEGRRMVSAAIRDITERKRIEAAAKINADRLASAVESIQDAFVLFDQDDRVVLCNNAYRQLLGTAIEGSFVGLPYAKLLDAWLPLLDFDDPASRERFRHDRLTRRPMEDTVTFDVKLRDGRRMRVIDRKTPDGGLVKTIWDLTDDMRREEEVREARTAAEAGSAAKSEFLSSMSHELRTPLNAILGFAQLLQRDRKEPLSHRHRERVDQILKGGEHLLRLIDDILDLSRIEAGTVSISNEPVNIADVLEEVRRTLGPIAARQAVHVSVEALPAGLPMISADRTRFAQILINFGTNAIKYNRPSGKVSFVISQPDADRVRVTVRDTGYGIPADQQDKLFQPFQRAGQETGPIEGTGIGLVITQRLARFMNGDVGFSSVPGEGSEFWVDMPVHSARFPSTAPDNALAPAPSTGPTLAHRVVLYVEDNPANVTFMNDLMSSFEGIDLIVAPTAEMGIELARDCHPEVIIMDINLPGMSGLDALGVLRSMPETEKVPVIALTAAASERDKVRGMQSGFYRYLTKPVKVDELIGALESLLPVTPESSAR